LAAVLWKAASDKPFSPELAEPAIGGLTIWRFGQILKEFDKLYMTTKTQERLKAQARVLKALAHPTRLLLVEELARKTRCVCELRDAAGLDISTVSKHLSLLRNAGIVEDEKRGLKVFYSLKTPCVLNFFKCVESVQKCSK
jgi:DNA-binding transcriptional ArsR family regulator